MPRARRATKLLPSSRAFVMLSPLKFRGDLRPSDGAPESLGSRDHGRLFRRLIFAWSAENRLPDRVICEIGWVGTPHALHPIT
jgi:hypothetical protein